MMTDRTQIFELARVSVRRALTLTGLVSIVTMTIVATFLVSAVMATPASGTLSSTLLARAAFEDPVDIKIKVTDGSQEVIHLPAAQDTVIQQVILAPGGQSGWHSHPGPVVVLVKSGELTIYDGESSQCVAHTYVAGQAFIDRGQGHPHLAANLSTTSNTEMWFTYFDIPPGVSPRIDVPNPGNCPF